MQAYLQECEVISDEDMFERVKSGWKSFRTSSQQLQKYISSARILWTYTTDFYRNNQSIDSSFETNKK